MFSLFVILYVATQIQVCLEFEWSLLSSRIQILRFPVSIHTITSFVHLHIFEHKKSCRNLRQLGNKLSHCDNLNFNQGTLWKSSGLKCGTCWVRGWEKLAIYFIHCSKVCNVRKKYSGLYDIRKVKTCCL